MNFPLHVCCCATLLLVAGCAVFPNKEEVSVPEVAIGGQSLFLRHEFNRKQSPNAGVADPSPPPLPGSTVSFWGNDFEATKGYGFRWLSVPDDVGFWGASDPADPNFANSIYKLPPGLAFGLKHSETLSNKGIRVGGVDPAGAAGENTPPGMVREYGGDAGAPSGKGFYWFETKEQFSQTDWLNLNAIVQSLPRGSILGLKHSESQSNKVVRWRVPAFNTATRTITLLARTIDPADPGGFVPQGFQRVYGGDFPLERGKGFWWLEKIVSVAQLHANVNLPAAVSFEQASPATAAFANALSAAPASIPKEPDVAVVAPRETTSAVTNAGTPSPRTAVEQASPREGACREAGFFEQPQPALPMSHVSNSGKFRAAFTTNSNGILIQFVDAASGMKVGPSHSVPAVGAEAGFTRKERFAYIIVPPPAGAKSTNAYTIRLQRLYGNKSSIELGATSNKPDRMPRFSPDETIVIVTTDAASSGSRMLATIKDVAGDGAREIASHLPCEISYSASVRDCNSVVFVEGMLAIEKQFIAQKLQ